MQSEFLGWKSYPIEWYCDKCKSFYDPEYHYEHEDCEMEDPIQTEDKILNVLKEQVTLYEEAIKICYSHGVPKSKTLEILADRLRDKLIEHQKEIIELQEKVTKN